MAYAVSSDWTLDKPILLGLDQTDTTDTSSELGKIVQSEDGRRYKCVVTDASCVTSAAGYPAYYMVGTTANEVTSDYSDAQVSERLGATFAGLFTTTITAATAQRCWIETPAGAVTADASLSTNVGVCDGLTAQNDSFLDVSTSDSDRVVAIAMEADTSNVGDIVMIGS